MSVVGFERTGSLGHIVLCDPPLNLIGAAFNECLKQAVHEAFESDIRALLVRAEGPNFSRGGDVAAFLKLSTETFRTFISEIHHSYRAIESMPIPTVAAVRGAAFGGAFELALACDFIVAADNAVFQSIEASVGSAPLCGAVQRVAERAGRARAVRYMMLSEPMSGQVAGEIGVAAFVMPEASVEAEALALAQRLANGPTRSYAAIRTLLKMWAGGGIAAADTVLLDVTMPLHSSEDARRGRAARVKAIEEGIEPSPPIFTGR